MITLQLNPFIMALCINAIWIQKHTTITQLTLNSHNKVKSKSTTKSTTKSGKNI